MQVKLLKLPKWVCNYYVNFFYQEIHAFPTQDIGLKDGDLTNIMYRSRRNPMNYAYLRSRGILALNWCIMLYLTIRTGRNFFKSINAKCAPVNQMTGLLNSSLKWHRDRYMTNDLSRSAFPKYIAVLCLNSNYVGGDFMYSFDVLRCSDDGKNIELDKRGRKTFEHVCNDKRFEYYLAHRSIRLQKGDLLILRNDNSAHAVDTVTAGARLTTTFRSL